MERFLTTMRTSCNEKMGGNLQRDRRQSWWKIWSPMLSAQWSSSALVAIPQLSFLMTSAHSRDQQSEVTTACPEAGNACSCVTAASCFAGECSKNAWSFVFYIWFAALASYGVGAVIGSEAANLIYYELFCMNLKGESNNAFHIYSKYFALMLSSMDMNFPYMHIYIYYKSFRYSSNSSCQCVELYFCCSWYALGSSSQNV